MSGRREQKRDVNPTYVGMNRQAHPDTAPQGRKPHIRGDEPYADVKEITTKP